MTEGTVYGHHRPIQYFCPFCLGVSFFDTLYLMLINIVPLQIERRKKEQQKFINSNQLNCQIRNRYINYKYIEDIRQRFGLWTCVALCVILVQCVNVEKEVIFIKLDAKIDFELCF